MCIFDFLNKFLKLFDQVVYLKKYFSLFKLDDDPTKLFTLLGKVTNISMYILSKFHFLVYLVYKVYFAVIDIGNNNNYNNKNDLKTNN